MGASLLANAQCLTGSLQPVLTLSRAGFDDQAEAAARFYCSIFDHSTITGLTHYQAMFKMKKLDIAELERAFAGQS